MAVNLETIGGLIETNRYNVEILPRLESFVQQQVEKQIYHLEANLTVLKLYQFHPELANKTVIGNILLKALAALPSTDFLLCMYLVPEKFQTEEPIKSYINLAHLLETAQFGAYWKESTECKESLDKVVGFHDAIRTYITNVVTSTYRTISKDFLSEVLALKSPAELDALVNSHRGWTATSDTVSFPKSEENVAKPKKITESVKFQDLTKIMAHLS